MPRQAARLVLGRSAKARLSTKLRSFSTTPGRRLADDDNAPDEPPTASRRERSAAAASAIGAMSRSSEPTNRPAGASLLRPFLARPANLGALRSGQPKIIDMKQLPNREGGGGGGGPPRTTFRRLQLGGGGEDGLRQPGGAKFGQTDSSGKPTGFAGRTGQAGPRTFGGPFRGGPRPGAARAGGPGGSRGGGGFGGGPSGRGGGGANKKSSSKTKRKTDSSQQTDMADTADLGTMAPEILEYLREEEMGGPETAYTPSTSLESLVGWGPAVATSTRMGQAEIAMRCIRTMDHGGVFDEHAQSFEMTDVHKWFSAGKPVFYSRVEQKMAQLQTMRPGMREERVEKIIERRIEALKKKHGNNYAAFVKAWTDLDPAKVRQEAEESYQARLEAYARAYKTSKTTKTKEAITRYAVKGEHPEITYSEDLYGKLAMYHNHGSTYRPADGAKFDDKMRTLIAN